MIVQNVRQTYGNQQSLAQLQDAQRFAMTVITDVVQAAGYFPTPATQTPTWLVPGGGPFATAGQALFGTQSAARHRTRCRCATARHSMTG